MQDILQEIIAHKHQEMERLYAPKPSLSQALLNSATGIIAEFKRRSPSRGWIKEDGCADIIPLSYQQNGAAALSIRQSGVTLPILYKNFIIDEAQLYAAALCGASAVLLIAACLTKAQCKSLMDKAHVLGLEVLLEMHSEQELEYADLQPDLCGINNRNLGSFQTDVENSFHLAKLLPKEAVKVSESGISNPDTVKALRQAGFRGFLIGENYMKTADPGLTLNEFISKL